MTRRDPSTFKSSVRKPADFDDYWRDTEASTLALPLNPRLTPVPMRSTPEVEAFEAHYVSYGGLEIAGWYCRPRHFEGKLPGYLFVPGYVSEPKFPTDLAMKGYAAFSAAPRNKLRSNGVFNPGYPGLLTHNIDERTEYGYRGFYMDAIRAFDFLSGLDEVDSDRICVQGGSQGGALTLLVSALRADQVACASAGAPYLCSMMDSASLTRSYPYEEINDYLRMYPEREQGSSRHTGSSRHPQLRRPNSLPNNRQHRSDGRRLPARNRICRLQSNWQQRQDTLSVRRLRTRFRIRSRTRRCHQRVFHRTPSTRGSLVRDGDPDNERLLVHTRGCRRKFVGELRRDRRSTD